MPSARAIRCQTCYQADKKIKIVQALFEDAEDDLVVGLFVSMNEHVPEGSHVLECRQVLAFDESPRPEVFFIFLPRDILCVPKRDQIFPQLR